MSALPPASPADAPRPPVTLALDTATPWLTLALAWPGGELHVSREVGRAHAELLPGAVQALFAEAGLPLRAGQIVIGTGPGSYTGVRVGASYALGLGRVWGAPVLGVSTLEALVRGEGVQGVSLDARKGNVYGAVFEVRGGVAVATTHAPARLPLEEFSGLLGGLPHHQDGPPDGLALLRAGLAHGQREWALAYL
ncbi:tRNA (adenosine(37)-N6)-threonylcarbamoyltransferase complex dimerization subunit type 1 TsaB [Deinococcus taeanensis]|uniref:tRNA (adenosine(37)-N6)-threonylcarbamoyltransferase complex dimerization subunit type 1 TsaB n=1 Tax=Deinococcus taeanensis TaxID=2737050 RepID=UPI001CDC0919|nr:tRNA (adenosine(37)-N6)-threonylcarbamoyltransferase complex dimerization subunit type 1 TsaB [Deinococcus taeanensis]UBV41904.1 tRNA (adenosine(37)-N6)-threonylcarbamoyltransferase complex dimerization subunit type 1 TsaB [Deinococcus taeanensis]